MDADSAIEKAPLLDRLAEIRDFLSQNVELPQRVLREVAGGLNNVHQLLRSHREAAKVRISHHNTLLSHGPISMNHCIPSRLHELFCSGIYNFFRDIFDILISILK